MEQQQFKDFLVECANPQAFDRTINEMGAVLQQDGPDNYVVNEDGCYISVSVGDATDKTTASAEKQAVVLEKLGSLFTCLP